MTSFNLKFSRRKKAIIFSSLAFIFIYILLYLNESAIIAATFADEIGHGYMTKNYYLQQSQFIRPSKWSGADIDIDILENLIAQSTGKGLVLKRASDAIYVRDTSENKLKAAFSTGYYDKLTNERGSMLCVGPVRWFSPIKVQVDVGWYYGVMGSARGKAVLNFNGYKWILVQRINEGLS